MVPIPKSNFCPQIDFFYLIVIAHSLERVKQKESFVAAIASRRSGEGVAQRIPFSTLWPCSHPSIQQT